MHGHLACQPDHDLTSPPSLAPLIELADSLVLDHRRALAAEHVNGPTLVVPGIGARGLGFGGDAFLDLGL